MLVHSQLLMWEGETQAALKMLSKDYENGVLKIDDNILTEKKARHQPAAEVKQDSLLFGSINELSHCYSHEIDEIMIAKAASLTKGHLILTLISFVICY